MYRVGFQSALGFTPRFLQVASQSGKTTLNVHFCMGVVWCPSYDPVLTQDNVQRPLDTAMDLISQIVTNPPKPPGHVVDSRVLWMTFWTMGEVQKTSLFSSYPNCYPNPIPFPYKCSLRAALRLLLWLITPSIFPSSVCHIPGKVLPESKGQWRWIHTFQYWKGALEILQRSKGQRESPGK